MVSIFRRKKRSSLLNSEEEGSGSTNLSPSPSSSSSSSVFSPSVASGGSSAKKKEYSALLYQALNWCGPEDISWPAAHRVLDAVKQETLAALPGVKASSTVDEVQSSFKAYIKSGRPLTVIRTLLIFDKCMFTADPLFVQCIGSKKWCARLLKISSTNLDRNVRAMVAYLLVTWANHLLAELANPFRACCQYLINNGTQLPPANPAHVPGELPPILQGVRLGPSVTGAVYAAPAAHGSPPLSSNTATGYPAAGGTPGGFQDEAYQMPSQEPIVQVSTEQVAAMVQDIHMLDAGIAAGGKAAAQEGDQIHNAWERCRQWADVVQSMLMQDMPEVLLAQVLEANDLLNVVLQKWDLGDGVEMPPPANDDGEWEQWEPSPPSSPPSSAAPAPLAAGIEDLLQAFPQGVPGGDSGVQPAAEAPLIDLSPADSQVPDEGDAAFDPFNPRGPLAPFPPTAPTNPFAAPAPLQSQTSLTAGDGLALAAWVSRAEKAEQEAEQLRGQMGQSDQRLAEATAKMRDLVDAMNTLQQQKAVTDAEALRLHKALEEEQARSSEESTAQRRQLAAEAEKQTAQLKQRTSSIEADAAAAQARADALQAQLEQGVAALQAATAEVNSLKGQKSQLEVSQLEAANTLAAVERKVQALELEKRSMEGLENQVTSLSLELKKESVLRKKAHNALRELKGNIRVCARLRPGALPGTSGAGAEAAAEALGCADEYSLALSMGERRSATASPDKAKQPEERRYEFDMCFPPGASQEEVYEEVKDMVQSAVDGYNVCVFCYGQTGSGKTHTVLGAEGAEGLLPRAMKDIWAGGRQVAVQCYMLELYQDTLIDLLQPAGGDKAPKLTIRRDPASGTVTVEGAMLRAAADAGELARHMHEGLAQRKVASTKMNSQSSRSHLIFSMLLRFQDATGKVTSGKMTFIDLAGSERVARSGAINDTERLNEAKAINKSLSALGDVVSALTTGESFIPYRNHTLTQLMADSLGGNAKCCMVVNVSPLATDTAETRNSLDYASRVKLVKNEASKSVETKEIMKLRATIDKQAAEIEALRKQVGA